MTKTKTRPHGHVTVADIDGDRLDQAAAILGTESPADTVDQALRQVLRRQAITNHVALLKSLTGEEYVDPRPTAW